MPEKYTHRDTKTPEPADAPPRIDALRVRFPEDSDGCIAADCVHEDCIGCVAEAEVSYTIRGTTRRLETLRSGGLWGICGATVDYRREVAGEELAELKDHLGRFGVALDNFDALAAATLADVKA